MGYIFGLDVSNYQGIIDWDKVNASLYGFVYCLCSDGRFTGKPTASSIGITDAYIRNQQLCTKPFGAYHFARVATTAARDMCESTVRHSATNSLPAMLDIEDTVDSQSLSRQQVIDWVGTWLTDYEMLDGRKPVLYSGSYFKGNGIFGDFIEYTKWLAQYTSEAVDPNVDTINAPALNGNPPYDIWQFTNKGLVDGIVGYVDKSITTASILNSLLNSETPMPSFVGITGEAVQYILVPGGKVGIPNLATRQAYIELGIMADHTIWYDSTRVIDGVDMATAIRQLPDAPPTVTVGTVIDPEVLAISVLKHLATDLQSEITKS